MGDGAKGKKRYTGQDRWEHDLDDILRITDKPCGAETKITQLDSKGQVRSHDLRFDDRMLVDLLRRREVSTELDSLRSRSYDQGGGGGSADSTQTEAAALAGLSDNGTDDWRDHGRPDPIGLATEEALAAFSEAARHLRVFAKKASVIFNAGSTLKGHQNQVAVCEVCDKPVSVDDGVHHRGRYCGTCNKDWQRAGRPHDLAETQWATKRRASLETGGKLWNQLNPERRTGYEVDEIDTLVAAGVLPSKSA